MSTSTTDAPADKTTLLAALAPVLTLARGLDLHQTSETTAALSAAFPVDGAVWQQLKTLCAAGRSPGRVRTYQERLGL